MSDPREPGSTQGGGRLLANQNRSRKKDDLIDFTTYFTKSDPKKAAIKQTARNFVEKLFRRNYDKYIKPFLGEIQERHRIMFNFQILCDDVDALNANDESRILATESFAKWFIAHPAEVIAILSYAVHNVYWKDNESSSHSQPARDGPMDVFIRRYPKHCRFKINARIINFPDIESIVNLKSHSVNKYVVIRGTVIRIGEIKPLVLSMEFKCRKCGGSSRFEFPDGKVPPITNCPNPNNTRCKSKNVQPLYGTAKCIDFQKLRVQEVIADETGGRVPRHLDVELQEDLVEQCIPGDVVTIGGIVRYTKCESAGRKSKRTLYQLYLAANSLVKAGSAMDSNHNGMGIGGDGGGGHDDEEENHKLVQEFTRRDFKFINKLVNEKDAFKCLVNSLCPSIYGHEIVKAGLLLAIVGGNTRSIGSTGMANNNGESERKRRDQFNSKEERDDEEGTDHDHDGDCKMSEMNHIAARNDHDIDIENPHKWMDDATESASGLHIRGDIHMLIVGDPGLGKSQMLRAVASIAPRGVYVSGNTTTVAGLTVTMQRDGGDNVLEAGALVMGDQGVCCIDEFDKMGNQHTALLEAMEQQSISIAKSGMVCTLSARTSVIAAANPCGGHWDSSKTDDADEKHDKRLSRHCLAALEQFGYSPDKKPKGRPLTPSSPRRLRNVAQIGGVTQAERELLKKGKVKLLDKLELSYEEHQNYDFIPEGLMRKYVVYARKYCHPKMKASAKKALLDFYLRLRREHQREGSTPITTRQLESMIRLAEARAKVELRQVVTEEDAMDVIEIMRASIYDVMADEVGKVDFRRSKGTSLPAMSQKFKRVLQAFCREQGRNRFSVGELKHLMQSQRVCPRDKSEALLDRMNMNNILLMKNGGKEYEFAPAWN